MRSYKDLAEEAGATVEAVRDAMGCAERREIPYTRMYDDFRSPPYPFGGPDRYGGPRPPMTSCGSSGTNGGVRSTGMGARARRPCWPRYAGTHERSGQGKCPWQGNRGVKHGQLK